MAFEDNNSPGNSAPTPIINNAQASTGDSTVTPPQYQSPQITPQVSANSQAPTQANAPQVVSNAPQPTQDPNANHPAVRRAGLLYSVAQSLAGGPRYSEKILDDGTRVRTPIPVSGKNLGFAIALEAIQGSMTGLAASRGRGPAAAAAAAMNQQIAQRQQADQAQDMQANSDFVNKASAYAANLRTRAMAQEIGMREEAAHKDWIAQHASTVNYIRNTQPGSIITDNAPESEVTTPEFAKKALENGWTAIPVNYVPRFDAQGNHYSKDGTPLHDNLYMVVDSRKIAVPDDVMNKAQSWGLPGFANTMNSSGRNATGDVELRIGTVLDTSNKIASLEQEQNDLNSYYSYLGANGVKGPDGKPVTAPNLKQLVHQNPALISYITGPWANHFAESPSAALKSMKDGSPKGAIANLYGGQQLLDKYDLLKDTEKKTTEKSAEAAVEIDKEKKLIPVKAAAAGAEARAREAATQPSGQSDGEIVDGMLDGTVDITKTASIRGNQRERYIALAKQKDPTFNMQTYGLRLKMNESYTSGKQGDQIQSFNTFMQHAADASDVTNEYRQTKSPLINKSLNWMAKNATGDPGYSKFVAAIEPVRKEFATFLEGGHALTESDKHAAATILSDDSSPAQIQAALKQMAHTGSIRLGSLDDRYRATFGHSYQGLLYPDTITAAQKLGLGDFAARYSSGRDGSPATGSYAPGSKLSNLQVNPQTGQQIGWNGTQWVDSQTGKAVK